MIEIAEIAAKARNLSRNTHDGIEIEEYLLRQLPTLSSDAARDALTELDQLRERVKKLEKADKTRARDISRLTVERDTARDRVVELDKALEPFADIAGESWADENGWTNAACPNDRICDWFGPSAFRTARRVREGGKV